MAEKGTYKYAGDEGSNLSLCGAGQELLIITGDPSTTDPTYVEATFTKDTGYCIAIKNTGTGTTPVGIIAKSVVADDLTLAADGVYNHGNETGDYFQLAYGDTIYGKFEKVSLEEPSIGRSIVKLIKGGQ
tara:strand:+ start:7291 stop:7680 length:390 start_codon:yes stop_codon:yes gene_type:complete